MESPASVLLGGRDPLLIQQDGLGQLPLHGQQWTESGAPSTPTGIPAEILEWGASQGASASTMAVLINEGFTSVNLIKLLQPGDIEKLNITLAQKLLIRAAVAAPVEKLSLGVTHAKPSATNFGAGATLDQAVEQIWGGQAVPVPDETETKVLQGLEALGLAKGTGSVDHESPLIHLAKPQKGTRKYLDIADFLLDTGLDEATQEGGEPTVKSKPQGRGKLDKVSQAQWCMANTKILAELLASGQLPQQHLADYLSYTVQVCQLAERYTWASVLQFDRDYRQKQALGQCRWGVDIGHIRSVFLVEKHQGTQNRGFQPRNQNQNQNRFGKTQNGPPYQGGPSYQKSERSDEVCRLFNQGKCGFARCKHKHECLVPGCTKPHTIYEHFGPGQGEPRHAQPH